MTQPNFEHSQFDAAQFGRRASDLLPPQTAVCACGKEMMVLLQKIEQDIRDIKHGMGTIRTGFVRNDLGEPDYEGHRQAHLAMIEKSKLGEKAKETVALKLIGWLAAFLGGALLIGIGPALSRLVGG